MPLVVSIEAFNIAHVALLLLVLLGFCSEHFFLRGLGLGLIQHALIKFICDYTDDGVGGDGGVGISALVVMMLMLAS